MTFLSGFIIGGSATGCPPDNKVEVLALGRTQLPSLCDYPVVGSVPVCGTEQDHAVQFLFNVSKPGMYRFDATASGFPAVLDIRNRGECSPRSCTKPIRNAQGEASRKTSLMLLLKGVEELAINIGMEGGGCGPGPVVLDISYETPYDINILVAPSLGLNNTELGSAMPSKDTPIIFNRPDLAFDFAFSRVGSFGPGKEARAHPLARARMQNATAYACDALCD
eukprot:tig00001269_g7972.t1